MSKEDAVFLDLICLASFVKGCIDSRTSETSRFESILEDILKIREELVVLLDISDNARAASDLSDQYLLKEEG